MNNKFIILSITFLLLIMLFGCDKKEIDNQNIVEQTGETEKEKQDMNLKLFIDEKQVPVIWEDNESVKTLFEYVKNNPLTIDMNMYGGFEQVGSLGINLPTDDHNMVTEAGDIVLYNGNQIVMFYGSNSWSYTKLGKVENADTDYMKQLLGSNNVVLTIVCE